MKKFEVQTTDDGMFRVARWNELLGQYELWDNKRYSTHALAEKMAQFAQDMYDKENDKQEDFCKNL